MHAHTSNPPVTVKVSGTQYQIQTKNDVISPEDVEGHEIGMWESKAIHFEGYFKRDGYVINRGIYDRILGNGTYKGYGTHVHSNADVHYTKWEGTMTSEMVNGHSISAYQGIWQITGGTGKWENTKGSGTYKGKVIASGISIMEWEGEIAQ
jgi:hypothetical protein